MSERPDRIESSLLATAERLNQTAERLDQTNVTLSQTTVKLNQTIIIVDQVAAHFAAAVRVCQGIGFMVVSRIKPAFRIGGS